MNFVTYICPPCTMSWTEVEPAPGYHNKFSLSCPRCASAGVPLSEYEAEVANRKPITLTLQEARAMDAEEFRKGIMSGKYLLEMPGEYS